MPVGIGSTALHIVQKVFPSVTQVVDGKKNIRINVTKADASSKAVRNHEECALAVACKRQLKLDGAVVARSVTYLIHGHVATRYRIPTSACREIVAFDRGAQFEPGEYQLNKMPPVMRFGVSRNENPSKPGSRPNMKKKAFRHTTENIRASLLS